MPKKVPCSKKLPRSKTCMKPGGAGRALCCLLLAFHPPPLCLPLLGDSAACCLLSIRSAGLLPAADPLGTMLPASSLVGMVPSDCAEGQVGARGATT
eukprot:366453-Chlamydomonas_euryale.AAC.23